jgi:hypothetical protein
MPYEIAFTKPLEIQDRDRYINECCVGGDIVVDRLLPAVKERYTDIQTEQEDWGWFIWFRKGAVRLAIDIYTDDPDRGEFRAHLTSRFRRWLISSVVIDTPELEEVLALVQSELTLWTGQPCKVTRLDRAYMPLEGEA